VMPLPKLTVLYSGTYGKLPLRSLTSATRNMRQTLDIGQPSRTVPTVRIEGVKG